MHHHDFYQLLVVESAKRSKQAQQKKRAPGIPDLEAAFKAAKAEMRRRHGRDVDADSELVIAVRTNVGVRIYYSGPGQDHFRVIANQIVLGTDGREVALYLRRLHDIRMPMMEGAKLGYFCVAFYHRFGLNAAIGLDDRPPCDTPQVLFVPKDRANPVRYMTLAELFDLEDWCKRKLSATEGFLEGFFA
jgi:hypothetical protein